MGFNLGKAIKAMANPVAAVVKAAAPNSGAAALASKVEVVMTKANPVNLAIDTSKAVTAGHLNFTSRLVTGKNAKTFSTKSSIGGDSYFAKSGEKLVQDGDKWMATDGKGVMAAGTVALAVVGTIFPPVGIVSAAAGAGFSIRNKVVDVQADKRAANSTSITNEANYENTGIAGGANSFPQGIPPSESSRAGVSAAQDNVEYARPTIAALLALPLSGYLMLKNELS